MVLCSAALNGSEPAPIPVIELKLLCPPPGNPYYYCVFHNSSSFFSCNVDFYFLRKIFIVYFNVLVSAFYFWYVYIFSKRQRFLRHDTTGLTKILSGILCGSVFEKRYTHTERIDSPLYCFYYNIFNTALQDNITCHIRRNTLK